MASDGKKPRNRKKYCVLGCPDLGAYFHSFPNPTKYPALFDQWLTVVGAGLAGLDPIKIHKNKVVCDYHFSPEQKVSGHRLIYGAVPCLYLKGYVASAGTSILLEHNYCIPRINEDPLSLTQLNSSKNIPDKGEDISNISKDLDNLTSSSKENKNQGEDICNISKELDNQTSLSKENKDQDKSAKYIIDKVKSTPRQVRALKAKLRKAKKQQLRYKNKMEKAQKVISDTGLLEMVTKNMTLSSKIFTEMQYRQGKKKPKGRRFNNKEKILALSIYKKSPKCYYLLSKYFKLPSAKTLKNVLGSIKIKPGINKIVFEKLQESVRKFSTDDRLCTVIFDEMSVTPHLQYLSSTDEIIGFDSLKGTNLANHALVFMIKGIKRNFKQPVAYFFTQSLKKIELKSIIKDVICHVQSTGLKVLATVCDQGATNVSAINSLIDDTRAEYLKKGLEWRRDFYEVGNQKIYHIYDVPHLFKGLRNNLLTKDLIYRDPQDQSEKTVKWDYFRILYEADRSFGELRLLHKITEEHVVPEKIKKMRVKFATQIFSRSVAVAANHFVARKEIPEECQNLVPFVLLLDKLFDSLNVSNFYPKNGKEFTGAVRKRSTHHKLWEEAIIFFKNVKFISQQKHGNKMRLVEKNVPSLVNLVKTIESIQALWILLSQKYSLDCMLTRNFNQDPIENFFGNVRSLGVRNVSPNCHAFEGAYKTLLLNNFSVGHAINSNCEDDFATCLQSLDFFLNEKAKYDSVPETQTSQENLEISPKLFEALSSECSMEGGRSQNEYVCGWVLKKSMIKVVRGCKKCKEIILSDTSSGYIQSKEYYKTTKALCYPSNSVIKCFEEIQNITQKFLQNDLKNCEIRERIELLCKSFVTYPFNCDRHHESLINCFTKTSINILVFSWCKTINRILCGKITYKDNDDGIKLKAQAYYNSHKHKK